MRMPGVIKAGTRSDALVSNIDYYPTISMLVGAGSRFPTAISGVDFSQAVMGNGGGRKYAFAVDMQTLGKEPEQVIVRSDRWKFARNLLVKDENKQYILFDKESDPDENYNVAYQEEFRDVRDELIAAIDGYLAQLKPCKFPGRKLKQGEGEED